MFEVQTQQRVHKQKSLTGKIMACDSEDKL